MRELGKNCHISVGGGRGCRRSRKGYVQTRDHLSWLQVSPRLIGLTGIWGHGFPKSRCNHECSAPPVPRSLTVTPEMTGARPSMSRCTSRTASSLLLSLNRFLASSSSASWNCSKVMVLQDFPLWVTDLVSPQAAVLWDQSRMYTTPDPYWSQPEVTSNCQQPGKNKEAYSLRIAKFRGFYVCSTVGTVVSPRWESRGKTRKRDPLISSRDTLTSQGAGGSPCLNLGQKWPVGAKAMGIIVGHAEEGP